MLLIFFCMPGCMCLRRDVAREAAKGSRLSGGRIETALERKKRIFMQPLDQGLN